VEQSSGKSETIVFFLAILEMVRNMDIVVYQSEAGGELIIREREEETEDGRQDRE
jgi:chromatin segregation and condensation protein Rec8/ScpA/Scc1 (kleisin family)